MYYSEEIQKLLDKPLCMMTGSEFLSLQRVALREREWYSMSDKNSDYKKRFVYGLRGIKELFDVSHATAQKLKDGVLKPAVMQNGRKIIVDVAKAVELFNENNHDEEKE